MVQKTKATLERELLEAQQSKERAETTYFRQRARYFKLLSDEVEDDAEWESVQPYNLRVYDFSGEVSADSVAQAINTIEGWAAKSNARIALRIVSPGGDVIEGLALYDFIVGLRADGVFVDTVSLGWAASMGSILMQCGSTRYIGPHASVLIHETREVVDWLEKVTDAQDRLEWAQSLGKRMNDILAERSTLTAEQISQNYSRRDWWLTAQEAIGYGFADALWKPLPLSR